MGLGQYRSNDIGSVKYDVDLVICIDATGSMYPVLNKVKTNAMNLYSDIIACAKQSKKEIRNIRIRLIIYRDYLADGEYAMVATDFFRFPQDTTQFANMLNSVQAGGGGDIPEDGLEAIAYAIRSDWAPKTQGAKRRQIIAVWTDAPTHDIGFGKDSDYYDDALPQSFEELSAWWGYAPDYDDEVQDYDYMEYAAKRLVLFAPEDESWQRINNSWDNVIYYPSEAGNGLGEKEYSEIIQLIVNSISA